VLVCNAEGKSVVDVARAMNSANSSNTSSTSTSTSSGGVRVGAVLFMVLMAAGLDPMTESAVLAAADEASHFARYVHVCAIFGNVLCQLRLDHNLARCNWSILLFMLLCLTG